MSTLVEFSNYIHVEFDKMSIMCQTVRTWQKLEGNKMCL